MRVGQRNKWVHVTFPPTCTECRLNDAVVSKPHAGNVKHLCGDCLTKPPTGTKLKSQGIETLLRELGLM